MCLRASPNEGALFLECSIGAREEDIGDAAKSSQAFCAANKQLISGDYYYYPPPPPATKTTLPRVLQPHIGLLCFQANRLDFLQSRLVIHLISDESSGFYCRPISSPSHKAQPPQRRQCSITMCTRNGPASVRS